MYASIAKPAATIVQGRPGNSAQGFLSIQSQLVNATIVSSPPNKVSLIKNIKNVINEVKVLDISNTSGLVLYSCVSSFQNSIGIHSFIKKNNESLIQIGSHPRSGGSLQNTSKA